MHEGPECRLSVEYLNKFLLGKNIIDWVFSGGKYTEKFPEGYEDFDKNLPMIVTYISCKGKFIYFELSSKKNNKEYYVLHSLMMSGNWQKNHDKYCKWFLELNNNKTLWFNDVRGFGTLKFTDNKKILENKLNSLGPDIMRKNFHLYEFKNLFKKYSNRNITSFLMDQNIISGCGNYIKCEVLYYASVSPLRKINDIKEREIEFIYEGLRIISRLSYNNNGASIRDYKNGYYQNNFKIYGKKYAKKTKTADGRITYWDPIKQI